LHDERVAVSRHLVVQVCVTFYVCVICLFVRLSESIAQPSGGLGSFGLLVACYLVLFVCFINRYDHHERLCLDCLSASTPSFMFI
jgi:hypothetical protein